MPSKNNHKGYKKASAPQKFTPENGLNSENLKISDQFIHLLR